MSQLITVNTLQKGDNKVTVIMLVIVKKILKIDYNVQNNTHIYIHTHTHNSLQLLKAYLESSWGHAFIFRLV